MKYCSNCGAQMQDKARFCTECGTKVQEIMDTQTASQNENVQPSSSVPKQEDFYKTEDTQYPENHIAAPETSGETVLSSWNNPQSENKSQGRGASGSPPPAWNHPQNPAGSQGGSVPPPPPPSWNTSQNTGSGSQTVNPSNSNNQGNMAANQVNPNAAGNPPKKKKKKRIGCIIAIAIVAQIILFIIIGVILGVIEG